MKLKTGHVVSTATLGAMVLISNMTGGQIIEGLTDYQRQALRSRYVRWIAIFALLYAVFTNIALTAVATLFVVILLDYLLNETSRYYLFRRHENGKLKQIATSVLEHWGHV